MPLVMLSVAAHAEHIHGVCSPPHNNCHIHTQENDEQQQQQEVANEEEGGHSSSAEEADDMTCAICLERTPLTEIALVKGCEHQYCGEYTVFVPAAHRPLALLEAHKPGRCWAPLRPVWS